jgi:hypothetical protein
VQPGPFQEFYQRSLAKGIKPTMVRLTLARKIACHYLGAMEERRKLRRRETEVASRLSVSGENLFPSPAILSRVVVDRFLRRSGSRVSIPNACRRQVPTEH